MSLLLLFSQPSGGGGGVTADLSVTDTADTLDSSATLGALSGVSCSLSVTDSSDNLTAVATITGVAVNEPTSLGGRNKLFDAPGRRLFASLYASDDDDQLYAVARVSQVDLPIQQPAKVIYRFATLHTRDDDDTLASVIRGPWPVPKLITPPRARMISSRYETAPQ